MGNITPCFLQLYQFSKYFLYSSLACWNLSESSYWHRSNSEQTVFAPCQIITPSLTVSKTKEDFLDLGYVVVVKCLELNDSPDLFGKYNPTQV